jgi:hypothetical protein
LTTRATISGRSFSVLARRSALKFGRPLIALVRPRRFAF